MRHQGRELAFGLRPEHISAGRSGEPGAAVVAGTVQLVEPLGAETLGLVRFGAGDDAGEMTGRFPPDAGLAVGESLEVSLALERFHLFDPESGRAIRGADW
jgi:multiple sugar transport system ATP-binding protein